MALKAGIGGTSKGLLRFNAAKARRSLAKVLTRFDNVMAAINGATVPAVREALEPIREAAVTYCPVDTGALRDSNYLVVRRIEGKVVAELGFAKGGKPFYAAQVHENLTVFHKPPTQAKFLQRAMEEQLDSVPERIAAHIRKKMRSAAR